MKWAIWALAAFFYFYEYFLRVAPSVMVPELMSAFSVNATAVGALAAFYFYIYAPMQLPVGVLTDKYGARKLLAFASASAGLGAVLFAIASNFWVAALGRILMGGASAFGFIGLVYICSHWFPENKRGILIGLGSSIGMVGAVMGQGPLRKVIDIFGWRSANLQLGILGLVIGAIIYIVVRNDPPEMAKYDEKMKKRPPSHILENLGIVCRNGYSWVIALLSLFIMLATPGFAGLWGIPFIHATYGISIELAGYAVSMIFIGWAVGGPVIGRLSDHFKQKKALLILTALLGAFLMAAIIYVPNLPLFVLFILFFFLGFVSSSQLLTYSYAIDINPEKVKATAAAFTNFVCYLGGALVQPFVGFLLDANWTGKLENGIRIYSPEAYKIALTCFPAAFLISAILGIFLKKSPHPQTIWQKYFS